MSYLNDFEDCLTQWEPDFANVQSGIQIIKGKRVEIWLIPCPCCGGSGTHTRRDGPMRQYVDCATCSGVGEWTLTNPSRLEEVLVIEAQP